MGFRFRRSVRLFPGLRLNVSRSRVSGSIGGRGAWLTIGPKGTRATLGIPGTGLSYTEQSPWARPTPTHPSTGIEVAELPAVAIEAAPAPTEPPLDPIEVDEDAGDADPHLLPIALGVAGIIALVALLWALLI